ncbi:MAG: hydantoinase/oxoprolinase family protein [Candidatus Tectomicrobia bacterium]|nr:hydantoinase/oxoprolinase family protein [Candidatus Tectomicrobia bacterium]
MARYTVGVDIGGTFSDLVCINDESGEMTIAKVPSTPPTFIDGIMNVLAKAGIQLSEISVFKHGSTIATNAILERKGALTGLITTKGFRDVLEAARGNRPNIYDLRWAPPAPLVLRRHRLTVSERIDYEGNAIEPLNEEEVRRVAEIFKKRGMQSVAICFINSFMNPEHERRAKELVEELMPDVFVCNSNEFPEQREFERTSTTVANAYLGPLVEDYYSELTKRAKNKGFRGDILVVHSGGGVISIDSAKKFPARTCQSGPAGGVMGGAFIGRLAGYENVITFDMGGTSTDLSLVYKGQPLYTPGTKVEFRVPVRYPSVDLEVIGAGGGSIAWIDVGGALKNGPQSAGAIPGPACYDQGGSEPTNTDANLVLGRLDPAAFLGGEMTLRPDLARAAIAEKIAAHFGMTVEEAAFGIIHIANTNMTNAIRRITVERGYDPRDFALVAFGGAGPLHAAALAQELSIPKIIVPVSPGVTSAFGVSLVHVKHDFIAPIIEKAASLSPERFNAVWAELEERAIRTLKEEDIPESAIELSRIVDVKYFPQTQYLSIPIDTKTYSREDIDRLVTTFTQRHEQEFGYTVPLEFVAVEIGNARIAATGNLPSPELRRYTQRGEASAALKGSRPVYFKEAGGFTESRIYERARLLPGAAFVGPAIIEQLDSTTVVPPSAAATVDDYLNLIIAVEGALPGRK